MKKQKIIMRHVRDWYDLDSGTLLHVKKYSDSAFLETLKVAKSFGNAESFKDSYLTPGASLKSANLMYLGTDIIKDSLSAGKHANEVYAIYFLYEKTVVYSRIFGWNDIKPEIMQIIKL